MSGWNKHVVCSLLRTFRKAYFISGKEKAFVCIREITLLFVPDAAEQNSVPLLCTIASESIFVC